MSELKMNIQGMTCGGCSKSILKRLEKFDFTENAQVDWEAGTGTVTINDNFDDNKAKVISTLGMMGFETVVA